MSREKKKTTVKLTREEKKRIAALLQSARQDEKNSGSAQDTIPYLRMGKDGICQVTETFYSKTVQFQDITYQLAQNEEKDSIFRGWCDFLNSFDSSVHVELSFLNLAAGHEAVEQPVNLLPQGDDFDNIREEYAAMLEAQLAKGNNGRKTKYITFGIEADSLRNAKLRLERVERDILSNFKRLGVMASPLDGKERLCLMYDMFHMDERLRFQFEWRWLPATGLSTKDFIAPSGFDFSQNRVFSMGEQYGTVSFFHVMAAELKDRVLADFLEMDGNLVLSIHIQAIDQVAAIKDIKQKITDLDRMTIDEQMKAVRAGYDMDIIPRDLTTYGSDAKKLLDDLQSRDERMFLFTFVVMNVAKTRKQLGLDVKHGKSIAQQHNCQLIPLDFQQEDGLCSCLPLALNKTAIQRGMTTSATAIFVPFTTQELIQSGGEALYYGLNALSNNLIMVDRKKLKNPNGLILGTPGSGKSFAAKREIVNCFLQTKDDMIICDPEGEYYPLVERLHGQIIRISPMSKDHINPLDINLAYADDITPIAMKSNFILSMMEIIAGGRYGGLDPIEISYIDKAVRQIYGKYASDPRPENMPILSDLYAELQSQGTPQSCKLAAALEIYVNGSLSVFNHRTNVNLSSRLVCYDIKELGQQMKLLGMQVVQDQVWSRVTQNRVDGKATRYYMDEFHMLLQDEQTANYSAMIWKRFRKWGGVPMGITQNVKDFLDGKGIENILDNSDFIVMLNQGAKDRQILAERLGISERQLSYVTNSGEGEGLLFYGSAILPFVDRFPKDTELYRIMTTKPAEIHAGKESGEPL